MDIEALKKIRSPVRRAAIDTMKLLEIEVNKADRSVDLIDELLAKLLDKEANLMHRQKEMGVSLLMNA